MEFETIIEPFKIKSVEPLPITSQEERLKALKREHWNIFGLKSQEVTIDLLTDSGTGSMSSEQWASLMRGDESYAGSQSWQRFEEVVRELLARAHSDAPLIITVALEQCVIADSTAVLNSFEIDEFRRTCLLEGLDRIGLTLRQVDAISLFEQRRWPNRPKIAPESY
mgnify:CR=1 FL=1